MSKSSTIPWVQVRYLCILGIWINCARDPNHPAAVAGTTITLTETSSEFTPENWWLEDDPVSFWFSAYFHGFLLFVWGGKQTNTQQHHNMILLMVQKSGNHQLSLVLYPIIYRDLAPSNPWFYCRISEPSDTLGEAIKIALNDRHWDSLHDAIPLEVLRVPQGKWMVNSGNKRRTQWSNEKGSPVV